MIPTDRTAAHLTAISSLLTKLAREFALLSNQVEEDSLRAEFGELEPIDDGLMIGLDLKLSTRTYNALRREGYDYLQQLQRATWEDLLNIRGFGFKRAIELRTALKGRDIVLSDDEKYDWDYMLARANRIMI